MYHVYELWITHHVFKMIIPPVYYKLVLTGIKGKWGHITSMKKGYFKMEKKLKLKSCLI